MENCVKRIGLVNGLTVMIVDHTRRYFEDYHLVKLELICQIPIKGSYFENDVEFSEARKLLGNAATYRRTLEKMGVPYAEIDEARKVLIDGFESNALRYFVAEDFPRKFVLSEFYKAQKKSALRRTHKARDYQP